MKKLTLLLFLALFIVACDEDGASPEPDYTIDQSEIGTEAGDTGPDFILTDINGNEAHLKNYRGKIILLEFWSTTCGICINFSPKLKEIKESYNSKDFEIISICISPESAWKTFSSSHDISWVNLLDANYNGKKVIWQYFSGTINLPRMVLLDRYGRIIDNELPVDKNQIIDMVSEAL